MPWGPQSILHDQLDRNKSNDGPILWIRPGEQSIPTGELDTAHERGLYTMGGDCVPTERGLLERGSPK